MSAGTDFTFSAMVFSDIYDYNTKTNVVVVGTCSLTVLAVGGGSGQWIFGVGTDLGRRKFNA